LADLRARVQLCGRIGVEVDGGPRESRLPGPQGRRLFAYLTVRRFDMLTRQDLADALWGEHRPASPEAALNALLSRLRAALAPVVLDGLRLLLPQPAWVDLEAARDAIHRAESSLAQRNWGRAWSAAQITLFTARRGFLPGDDLPWITEIRHELDTLHLRALEAYTLASLNVAGTELATAERSARDLVARAPFRESGYRALMAALAAGGNTAEALRVYDRLLRLLRDELGVLPSEQTRDLHARLLRSDSPPDGSPGG
jgi:SARP family transcriptional regulator, regulator of embCAB operon